VGIAELRPEVFTTVRCLEHFGHHRWPEVRAAGLDGLARSLDGGLNLSLLRETPGAICQVRCDPLDGEDPLAEPLVPLVELLFVSDKFGDGWMAVVTLGQLRCASWEDPDRPPPAELVARVPPPERGRGRVVVAVRDEHPDNERLVPDERASELATRRLN
jgi:hypothetical protein